MMINHYFKVALRLIKRSFLFSNTWICMGDGSGFPYLLVGDR